MATQKKASSKSSTAAASQVRIVASQDLDLNVEARAQENPVEFSNYVRSLMQNWRQGTVGAKARGEVSFSTIKPWKQKGTGRARAGSRRSPLWRKGGVTFGPQPRVRTLKVSKDLKNRVLQSLLWQNLESKNVVSLDWTVQGDVPKTSYAYKALRDSGLHTKQITLFVSSEDHNTHSSFSNIPNVRMLLFDQPNAYTLAQGECWVFLSKDMESFKRMVNQWI
jgi:large subunit ribosomal protein L4